MVLTAEDTPQALAAVIKLARSAHSECMQLFIRFTPEVCALVGVASEVSQLLVHVAGVVDQ